LHEVWEPLHIVNSWYAEKTSTIKANNIAFNTEKVGVANIQSKLGTHYWFTGHNPMPTLGLPFMKSDGEYAHFEMDKGMAEKFGGQGAYVLAGPCGVVFRGFESRENEVAVDQPDTLMSAGGRVTRIGNQGLSAGEFLSSLMSTLADGGFAAPVREPGGIDFRDMRVINGGESLQPAGHCVVEGADLDSLWEKIVAHGMDRGVPYDMLKIYISSCMCPDGQRSRLVSVQEYVADIMRSEEDAGVTSDPRLIELIGV
jgi:hypothetical protein